MPSLQALVSTLRVLVPGFAKSINWTVAFGATMVVVATLVIQLESKSLGAPIAYAALGIICGMFRIGPIVTGSAVLFGFNIVSALTFGNHPESERTLVGGWAIGLGLLHAGLAFVFCVIETMVESRVDSWLNEPR